MAAHLKWELRYIRDGHSIETLIARGVPHANLPEWYQDEPILETWDEIYISSFWNLSTERSIGFAMGAIPHSKIVSHGKDLGLVSGTLGLFKSVIRSMDDVYLAWSNQEQTRARQSNKQPTIPVGGKTKRPKH